MDNKIYDYRNSRGENKKNIKKKFDFKKIKNNTVNSLNEVECFLHNFHTFRNYIKLYKILK